MAKEGAKVVIADFNEAGAKEAAENIKKQGGEAAGVFLDAGQADSLHLTSPNSLQVRRFKWKAVIIWPTQASLILMIM
jgi:NAD(P)-dependent dehydrogenase (short-subunit alcohol dehydrogenase family)